MKRLVIIGAGGHGRVVADIAELNGYQEIVFLDGNPDINECAGYPVIGSENLAAELEGDLFIAIGNLEIRRKYMNMFKERNFPVLIHPKAVVARDTVIKEGTVVMAGAVINPGSVIGRGVIINTSSSVDHDCRIGEFCHIAVGAHLSGTVHIGNNCWIGTGVVISNDIEICSDAVIGTGAVVIRNIDDCGTYIGFPAKKSGR